MVPKLDLVKERQDLYRPSVKEPILVDVPEMSFLMVDGQGDPNTAPEYAQALHTFIVEQGYSLSGKHHEIYLGDPRRTAPERLKTVVRQPVAP